MLLVRGKAKTDHQANNKLGVIGGGDLCDCHVGVGTCVTAMWARDLRDCHVVLLGLKMAAV